jgi:hypothetical protein
MTRKIKLVFQRQVSMGLIASSLIRGFMKTFTGTIKEYEETFN